MALPDPLINKKLGDYKIMSLLGKGGMARVYKGYDEALDRYAAVKVIASEFQATADELEYTERFQKEARAIARLHHPHIVGVYQFGQAEGLYYMAMVFLDGEDLRFHLRNYAQRGQKMPLAEILQMTSEIAVALDYAHKQGVIHRDIKPSNIMMTDNGAVLTDFGLALRTSEGTMGDTFGSAHYIAPEQAVSSARAVPQSDLYSLGIVLYESLAGRVPFDDPSAMSVALKHLNEAPPPITTINSQISPALERVINKILHKDPKQRYVSGKEFIKALYEATDEKPIEVVTSGKTVSQWADETWEGASLETQPESKADNSKADAGGSPLESYLQSLREGSYMKRPSLAKNILSDIIRDEKKEVSPEKQSDPSKPSKPASRSDSIPKKLSTQTMPLPVLADGDNNARRLPIPLIAGAVVLLLLLVGGIFMFGGGDDDNGDDNNPTATQLAAADMTGTAIALLPTATATDEPTATPTATDTLEPTATATATDTLEPTATATEEAATDTPEPTATNTRRPTATPTDGDADASATPTEAVPTATTASGSPVPSPSPVFIISGTPQGPEIRLVYNENWVKVFNISSRRQSMSGISFVGDTAGEFEAGAWADQAGTEFFRMRSGGCFQLVIQAVYVDTISCRLFHFWVERELEQYHFWTTANGNTSFSVMKDGDVLAECDIEAGVCEFALP